jgi:hypothetical protein
LTASITNPQAEQRSVQAGALAFRNNYAINHNLTGMPTGNFSVGFWARTPAIDKLKALGANQAELFSYATHLSKSSAGADRREALP